MAARAILCDEASIPDARFPLGSFGVLAWGYSLDSRWLVMHTGETRDPLLQRKEQPVVLFVALAGDEGGPLQVLPLVPTDDDHERMTYGGFNASGDRLLISRTRMLHLIGHPTEAATCPLF